jgi:alanine-glyoxylate transaminase/serine-glyoxylate transaminase/serine-pyruvate transaminase
MGHGSRQSNVTLLLAALETCLRDLGQALEPGAGLAAASEVYSRTGQPAMA